MQVYSLGQNRNVRNTTLPRGSADLASTELAVCVSHGSFPRSATTSLFLWNGKGGRKRIYGICDYSFRKVPLAFARRYFIEFRSSQTYTYFYHK